MSWIAIQIPALKYVKPKKITRGRCVSSYQEDEQSFPRRSLLASFAMLINHPDPSTKELSTSSGSDTSKDCKGQVEAETESFWLRAVLGMMSVDIVVYIWMSDQPGPISGASEPPLLASCWC